jgi:hypothetical protein
MNKYILILILSFMTKSVLSQQEESYFPLAVGNSWEYDWDDGLGGGYKEYVSIVSKVLKPNGKYYYTFQSEYSNHLGYYLNSYFRIDDSNNVYKYYDQTEKEYLSEKFNAKIGELWITGRFGPSDAYKGCILYDTTENIWNKVRQYKYVSYTIGLWFQSIQFVKGIGIYYISQEAYTRVTLNKFHIIPDGISNPKNSYEFTPKVLLLNNYPNPFNPETKVKFIIKDNSNVILTIYDIIGREIKSLYEGQLYSGEHIFFWNGKDEHSQSVPSGVYFCRFTLFDRNGIFLGSESKKMLLMR